MNYPDITYIELDGRGNDETFQTCVLDALKKLKAGEGLHIIKDFESMPLYELMERKGMDRYMKKVGEEEYHAWFFPKQQSREMQEHLDLDMDRMNKILDIKLKVFRNKLTPAEARELVNKTFDKITPEEFAYGEQHMLEYGITDDVMVEGMDDIIEVFKEVLVQNEDNLPEGHPIHTYRKEANALDSLLEQIEQQRQKKFIKNEWLELYEKLNEINIHFSRKQNQLFSLLEQKGFDRPSKVMWTFDNKVRDAIKEAWELLNADKDNNFLQAQENVIYLVRDILDKERDILYPTSLKLISDQEFAQLRISDDEIGYCLIDNPPEFKVEEPRKKSTGISAPDNGLVNELVAVLKKHQIISTSDSETVHDVNMGKLTLEQINLVFKHLQIDLSYVDEHDVVKFYSDTAHRVFPRSAGVIGRKVQNCHPRESVDTVEAIIEAFRNGEQDKAEFWLEMGGKFIYIIYNAVRDAEGNYRGVLEMMQDATHIRSLTGSQKLLTWEKQEKPEPREKKQAENAEDFGITRKSIIAPLLKKYPYLKEYLISLNPKYKQLNNPVVFNTMGNVATLEMIAARGGFKPEELLNNLIAEVKKHE